MALVLLPVVIFTAVLVWSGWQARQNQALTELEALALSRESQLALWKTGLFAELNTALAGKEAIAQASTILGGPLVSGQVDSHTALQERLTDIVEANHQFDTLFLLDTQGVVVLSTNLAQISGNQFNEQFFQLGLKSQYFQPLDYDPNTGRPLIYVSRPVKDALGVTVGVLAGRAREESINQILQAPLGLNNSGEAYLVARDYTLLTPNQITGIGVTVRSRPAEVAIEQQTDGAEIYRNYAGANVLGAYRWLPDLRSALIVEQNTGDVFQQALPDYASLVLLVFLFSVLAFWMANVFGKQITTPLNQLSKDARQILSTGGAGAFSPVKRADEIGELASQVMALTANLQGQIGTLQAKNAETEKYLLQGNDFLQAFAGVSQAVSSVMEPGTLIDELVGLIHDRFGLYYCGLFLVTTDGQRAMLQAAAGEGARSLLARGHSLEIGENSMIGWCIANREARVAQEAADDLVRLATPELPLTRSEAALPLRSRGRVIGALSVQSTEPNAFDAALVGILQAMTDQAAVALDNARLFEENRQALETVRFAYGQMTEGGWTRLLRSKAGLAYEGNPTGVRSAVPQWENTSRQALATRRPVAASEPDENGRYLLALPVEASGLVLGTLNAYKDTSGGAWQPAEIQLLEAIVGQLGLALESSRLFEETQRRAEFEKLTNRVSASLRERLEVESVLRTAAQELRKALALPEVTVRLAAPGVTNPTEKK